MRSIAFILLFTLIAAIATATKSNSKQYTFLTNRRISRNKKLMRRLRKNTNQRAFAVVEKVRARKESSTRSPTGSTKAPTSGGGDNVTGTKGPSGYGGGTTSTKAPSGSTKAPISNEAATKGPSKYGGGSTSTKAPSGSTKAPVSGGVDLQGTIAPTTTVKMTKKTKKPKGPKKTKKPGKPSKSGDKDVPAPAPIESKAAITSMNTLTASISAVVAVLWFVC